MKLDYFLDKFYFLIYGQVQVMKDVRYYGSIYGFVFMKGLVLFFIEMFGDWFGNVVQQCSLL